MWGAKCILVAPTAFRTAMSKIQAAKQLEMPAAGSASASANANTAAPKLAAQLVAAPAPDVHPPDLAVTKRPPAPSDSEPMEGDFFTLKSNTIVQTFGTFGERMDGTPNEIYMVPNSTEATVLANVQLEFMAYFSPSSVKVKPALGFQ